MTKHQHIGTRQKLAPRRLSETRKIAWVSPANQNGWPQTIYITIGYDGDGITPREIFYDSGYKSGSDMEALISDVCILLSIVIQHDGVNLEAFLKSLASETNERTKVEEMGSIVGVLLAELKKPPEWAEGAQNENT